MPSDNMCQKPAGNSRRLQKDNMTCNLSVVTQRYNIQNNSVMRN